MTKRARSTEDKDHLIGELGPTLSINANWSLLLPGALVTP